MILAAEYPLLNVFWTILIFFSWVIWIWVVITILSDVFGRDDLSGWGKAGWTVLIIVLPFLGVLGYLIGNSGDMARRRAGEVAAAQARFDDHVRSVAAKGGPAYEIQRAKGLLNDGTITADEFASLKAKALA